MRERDREVSLIDTRIDSGKKGPKKAEDKCRFYLEKPIITSVIPSVVD